MKRTPRSAKARAIRRRRNPLAVALTATVLLACASPSLAASPAPAAPLRFGAAWYPEQWPQARWDADLTLMQAAHINVVRVGEFAWSALEPKEGQFDFAWLDRAIAAAAAHHIAVVLGTPTAAPPAWLTRAYPDVLRVDEDGTRAEHGGRQQFSLASPRYRQFARRIAEQMAIHYGHNADVLGWQIDNEIGVESFDDAVRNGFHRWLAVKYGSISALNTRWATAYWSQTYDDFDEVPLHTKDENPALLLDLQRYFSDTWNGYVQDQATTIRAHSDPGQFVTTNTQHWDDAFDHYKLHQGLDIAAWDEYVPDGRYDWLDQAVQQDLARGYKRKNFWVMETQPAFVNWSAVNQALKPGQVREMAWEAIGHGADAVLYWQWRSALNGQEQYHGVLVGADDQPAPVYAEIARTGAEFAKASQALAGTSPHAEVAMLNDYDSRWAIDFQRHSKAFDPVAEFQAFYRPLELKAQAVDVISSNASLAGYRLVVAPALNVLTADQARRLGDYVRDGGHLVLGPRTGMKDIDNALNVERQPGPLAPLLGGRVEQFYALDTPAPVAGAFGSGKAQTWAEALSATRPDTQVDMRYGKSGSWLDDQPAVLSRRVGRGTITYLGAWFEPTLMTAILKRVLDDAGVRPIVPGLPPTVEAAERSGDGKVVLVLINHGDNAAAVALPRPGRDILGYQAAATTLDLGPHQVGVYLMQDETPH